MYLCVHACRPAPMHVLVSVPRTPNTVLARHLLKACMFPFHSWQLAGGAPAALAAAQAPPRTSAPDPASPLAWQPQTAPLGVPRAAAPAAAPPPMQLPGELQHAVQRTLDLLRQPAAAAAGLWPPMSLDQLAKEDAVR